MYSSIENTNQRLIKKFNILQSVVSQLQAIGSILIDSTVFNLTFDGEWHYGRKKSQTPLYQRMMEGVNGLGLNILSIDIEKQLSEYHLNIINLLSEYYAGQSVTKEFHNVISSLNITGALINLSYACEQQVEGILPFIKSHRKLLGNGYKDLIAKQLDCKEQLKQFQNIGVEEYIDRENQERCECGGLYYLRSEKSELFCEDCMRTVEIVGSAPNDEINSYEERKTKHGGQDIIRHLNFWIERLQATERKIFDEDTLTKIRYIIRRDEILVPDLTCERMRLILKDPYVDETRLNEHAPLLVKTFGGIGPPQLTYSELKTLKERFIRTMVAYSEITDHSGNNPYYPHFIYKIIEEMFKDNKEKLRLLNFIHLQSAETVEKNDAHYEKICNHINDPESGFVFRPTSTL